MAGGIGAANIRLGADISGFISGFATASQAVNQFTTQVNTNLTRAYRQADAANKTFRNGLTRLSNEVQDIGQRMAVIGTLPTLFAAGASYKSFADLEKLDIGLKQYGETLQTVKDLAKLPNISIEGAAQSLIQLRAVGVQSDLAQKAVRNFANALTAAGKSSIDLNPALTNVVQMLSTGVVSAADVKELANRIPQARKALMDAFGTASGEELTKIGPEKVVAALIDQLGKISPVAGGAGMALEKFGDSAQFATARMGEILDKSFGITGVINNMADSLESAVDVFGDWDPKTQKLVLSMTALAAAVPAATVAVGGLMKAGVAVAAGLGVAATTVGTVAAAVVVGGALIISHWDEVKSFLTETGVWTTVRDLASSTMDIVSNTFKTVGALLNGNWSDLWTGLRNTVASAVNFLNTAMFGLAKQIGLAVSAITGLLQMDGLSKWIREQSHGLDDVLKKLNISMQRPSGQSVVNSNDYGRQFATDDAQTKAWAEQQEMLAKIKPVQAATILSITELEKRLSELTVAYKGLKPGEENFAQNKSGLLKQISQVNGLLSSQNKVLTDVTKASKTAAEHYAKMSDASFRMWQIDLVMKWDQEQQALKDEIKSFKEFYGVVSGLNNEILKGKNISDVYLGADQAKFNAALAGDRADETFKKLGKGITGEAVVKKYQIKVDTAGVKDAERDINQLSQSLEGVINQTKADLISGATENFVDVLMSTEKIGSTASRVSSIIGSAISQIGRAILAYGVTIEGLKKVLKAAFSNPYVAVAVGAAAVVAGKVLQNKASNANKQIKLAKGGLAYGETMAVVGDNPGARFNPEVITPLDKLQGMIQESMKSNYRESGGGGEYKQIGVQISGTDLKILLQRVNNRDKSLGIG